ncbi:MCP four helix bundle domain-containing protein, partial [Shewanella sp. C31]|nr:MCP four helix bundle domain-containing protein [Shewanella electrica]
ALYQEFSNYLDLYLQNQDLMISKLQANDPQEAKRIMSDVLNQHADKMTKALINIGQLNTDHATALSKKTESDYQKSKYFIA